MELSQLQDILLHTYSTDNGLRKQAEHVIEQLPRQSNSVFLLLQLLQNLNLAREIRQAGAIAMKNIIQKQWVFDDKEKNVNHPYLVGIPENDKVNYRQCVLQSVLKEEDTSVRSLMIEGLNTIVRADYPEKWNSLIGEISTVLQTPRQEYVQIYNCLLCLRRMVKIYEYKSDEMRMPLENIVDMMFPLLKQIFLMLLNGHFDGDKNGELLHLICKIFWSCMQFSIPRVLMNGNELVEWLEMFHTLVKMPISEQSLPKDEDERHQYCYWKAKKWVIQILCRLYSRYSNPKHVEPPLVNMANYIRQELGPKFLACILELLALRSQGRYCPDRVVQLCLVWCNAAIDVAATYQLIKPHLSFLLFQVIHPLLCLSNDDLQLWEEDPHEFVRKTHDVFEDFYDPVLSASTLLSDLCRKRSKDSLQSVLTFYNTILNNFQQKNAAERTLQDSVQKDSALHAIDALGSTLTGKKSIYKGQMEELIATQVIPEFSSPFGFLRLRACRLISKTFLDHFVYQNEATLQHILVGTLKCMQDVELPVKIEAAKTLRYLVVYEHSTIMLDELRPLLPSVLDQYFRLMDEIGNDEVVCALETIIDAFGDEIVPFANELVVKLVECFSQFANQGEEDDDSVMAAMQCLDAITTIFVAIHNNPSMYSTVGNHVVGILSKVLSSDAGLEYLDSSLDILSSITFYGNSISPEVWTLFPVLISCFECFGWDYLSSIIPVIDNFVGRDVNSFINGKVTPISMGFIGQRDQASVPAVPITEGQGYVDLVFGMLRKILNYEGADSTDIACICRLLYAILHNCFGQVDQYVPSMVGIVLEIMARPNIDEATESNFMNVVASLFHYNPVLTLKALEMTGATEMVFQKWIGHSDQELSERLQTNFDKKLFALGLTALIRVPVAQLPAFLQKNVSTLLRQIAEILRLYVKQQQENKQQQLDNEASGDANEYDDDAYLPEGGYDSHEDCEDEDAQSYASVLRDLRREAEMGSDLLYNYNEFDEDEDEYSSGLDSVDPVVHYIDSLNAAMQEDQAAFAHVQSQLDANYFALFQALQEEALNRRQLAVAASAQKE